MDNPKAKILEIGTFDEDGQPTDWSFAIEPTKPFEVQMQGTLESCGYTLEELHEIALGNPTTARRNAKRRKHPSSSGTKSTK